jgi:hypothetical protein
MDIDIAKAEFEALILRVAAQHPDAGHEELVPVPTSCPQFAHSYTYLP